ncbi:MAG: Arm DNA-binding domain-containing protein, partial [Cyanobacteria bacterium]|nr:Arm DNA-binding domain-containing protein [Cyanobacteriota bacterium]
MVKCDEYSPSRLRIDATVPGLAVSTSAKIRDLYAAVTSKGQKTFYIRKRVNGKNEKHFLGSFPDLSVEQAREKAARFAGAVAFGDNPAEQRRILRGELTLGDLFTEYLDRHLKK